MKSEERWLLPDGVEEVLPGAAMRLERLRRRITDLFDSWGYDLVIPPLVEYLDSLLTGSAQTLELQTFKIVDRLNGRTMGVRADMTPQVARIDSHRIARDDISRLFYIGSVLRTMPDAPGGSRTPLQLGAEIYGHAGIESDIEIINLMLALMDEIEVAQPVLDLGHVGVYRGLLQDAELSEQQEHTLFDAMLRRSQPEINQFLSQLDLDTEQKTMFAALSQLHGGIDVLDKARAVLSAAGDGVKESLNALTDIVDTVVQRNAGAQLHLDLAELRGYSYHTGVVYCVFDASSGEELARGGRYDDIGAAFGRRRAATGFSADLKQLFLHCGGIEQPDNGIYVEDTTTPGVWQQIELLRGSGERVVVSLPGAQQAPQDCRCNRKLVFSNKQWVVNLI